LVSCSFENCLTWGSGEIWNATLLNMHNALMMNAKLMVMANHDLGGAVSLAVAVACWAPLCATATLT
jgi:hypothetical protein